MSSPLFEGGFRELKLVAEGTVKPKIKPKKDDAVLGGGSRQPLPGSVVLGTGRQFARLFDCFNSEAKAINGTHQWLRVSERVALVRRSRAEPLEDIKVKYLLPGSEHGGFKGWWVFAGYLKHDGPLFGHTAKYDPARCPKEYRSAVHQDLTQKNHP